MPLKWRILSFENSDKFLNKNIFLYVYADPGFQESFYILFVNEMQKDYQKDFVFIRNQYDSNYMRFL